MNMELDKYPIMVLYDVVPTLWTLINPLTAKDDISSWKFELFYSPGPQRVPRRVATHAPLCNNLASNKSKISENFGT